MLHHQSVELSSYRPQTVMTCLAIVSCLCGLLYPGNALAQEALHVPESSATGCAAGVQERFLRVESKFVLMMHVGDKLTQNGKVLDPGFFSIIPDSAVNGSKTARGHLSHARIAHGAAFAAFLTTAGLLVGAEVIRQQHDGRWTNPSTAMALGSVVTFLFSVGFAHWRDWETFETVNSYNHDLVSGQLDH
jgi:hypothetical protein